MFVLFAFLWGGGGGGGLPLLSRVYALQTTTFYYYNHNIMATGPFPYDFGALHSMWIIFLKGYCAPENCFPINTIKAAKKLFN